MDREGRIRNGYLEASNIADLETRLGNIRLELIRATVAKKRRSLLGKEKVSRKDLIAFCLHMAQFSKAGVPVLTSLTDFRDSVEHPRFKEVIANLAEEIEAGMSLSDSLKQHPAIFDDVFVNLVRAGEFSGQLADVLDSLTASLKWQDELHQQTKKLIMTPAIIGIVVMGVTIFLMNYLVPQLIDFIISMDQEIPGYTRALIATSGFFQNYWYIAFPAPFVIWFSIKLASKLSYKFRYFIDNLKLKTYMFGPVIQKITLSRFANFFAMLYSAGIPIIKSLEVASEIVSNTAIRKAIDEARDDIEQGQPISLGFEITGMFPPLVIRMLKIGETTGSLGSSLLNVSYFYDREIRDSIDKLQNIIQPAMTVIMGLMLGWVMMSVLGPVYDSISNLQM